MVETKDNLFHRVKHGGGSVMLWEAVQRLNETCTLYDINPHQSGVRMAHSKYRTEPNVETVAGFKNCWLQIFSI